MDKVKLKTSVKAYGNPEPSRLWCQFENRYSGCKLFASALGFFAFDNVLLILRISCLSVLSSTPKTVAPNQHRRKPANIMCNYPKVVANLST